MSENLSDLVANIAAREPDKWIFTFLHADRDEQTITARQLHRDASLIAALLDAHGVNPGDIVPLVFDHSYELVATFWGAIYQGAVPTILPYVSRSTRSEAHLAHIGRLARFANARIVVTTSDVSSYVEDALVGTACRVLALPSFPLSGSTPTAWPRTPHDPPYIQFSSGTTGSPKGVVLSHDVLFHYCRSSIADFAFTSADVTVGWLPLHHDMGLLTQIFEPLSVPRPSVLMSPRAWLSEPQRLFHAVHRFSGTVTWMPNFAFRYCSRRVRDEQIAGVDLASWRIVGNGSEPVLLEDLEEFSRRFAGHGLNPNALTISYGMAEHVAGLTWTPHDRAPDVDWIRTDALDNGKAVPAEPKATGSRPIVSCGPPMRTAALRIVDDADRDLKEREVGEVIARSPMLFKGYYAMPEESATALRDGWLHTGDLGYLADGQLYVCGRKKDLIIVGGRNIHPHHLEAVATDVLGEQGRFAVAFGVPNPELGTEMPVVVCEMRERPDAATRVRLQHEVRERMQRTLDLFVGDVDFVDKGWIVKTTSGKINRVANRRKFLSAREDARAGAATVQTPIADPPNGACATERRLLGIWQALFKQQQITLTDDFFTLGGDSLLAAQLAVEIEEQLHTTLPPSALLEAPTISGLARLLDQPSPPARPTLVHLQPVRAPAHRPVFFCVHGIGGGILDYRPLSQALGPGQPFSALQARGLDGAAPIDTTIEAMAAHYVETIKVFQPLGPYYLGGYCFGGIVAFEMARQLTAGADEVALVAILEGYAPGGDAQRNWALREWYFALNFVRTLPYWLRDYVQLGRMQMRARNRRLVAVVRKRLLRMAGVRVELTASDMLDGLSSRPAQLQKMVETHLAAARRYVPTPYDGRVVLFRTRQRLLQAPEHDMGWGRLSRQPVDVQMIAGSHGTILQEPHVRSLAEKLTGFLAASPAMVGNAHPSEASAAGPAVLRRSPPLA